MHHLGFISSQMGRDRSRKIEKKNYHFDPSYPTQNRKFQKKEQKNSKNWKAPFRLHFKLKRVRTGREGEKKKLSFRSFLHDPE